MDTEEIWRQIDGFPDYYISDMGRVLSKKDKKQDRILKQDVDKFGYCHVSLSINQHKKKNAKVASLVMDAWLGPLPYGLERCHKNGNSLDNRLSNLEYKTGLENNRDRYAHGTMPIGEVVHNTVLTPEQAKEIFLSEEANTTLAIKYGVSTHPIWAIRNRKAWTHITKDMDRSHLKIKRAPYGSAKAITVRS